MTIQKLGPTSTVILGLSLVKDESTLLKSAVSLLKKTGARIVLTHCMRPFYSFAYAGEGTVYPMDTYENILNEMDAKAANEKLESIKASFFNAYDCRVEVTRDYASEGLINAAKEFTAELILVGADLSETTILTGMSTSITLMKQSPVPTLIIPDRQEILFEAPFPALITDNLEKDNQKYLAQAYGFLQSIDADQVIQVHVQEVHEKELERLVENVKTAMILGKIPDDETFSAKALKERINKQAVAAMEKSCQLQLSAHECKHYQFELAFGKPAQEIQDICQRIEAKLIVFGHHHFFHRNSLSLGRMPWKSMLNNECGILVINES